MSLTAEDFRNATGREAEDDDLDRVNCSKVGNDGHWMCGWCYKHNMPFFDDMACLIIRMNAAKGKHKSED
jgi:hypothetical protein